MLDRNFEQLDRYVGPLAIATMVAVLGYYLYRSSPGSARGIGVRSR